MVVLLLVVENDWKVEEDDMACYVTGFDGGMYMCIDSGLCWCLGSFWSMRRAR